jgi:hypothetical protein
MENDMRDILLDALRKHAEGHVAKHKANVEVYLHSTTGIGEHPDIVEAMEAELMEIAKYDDVLEMIDKYFGSAG